VDGCRREAISANPSNRFNAAAFGRKPASYPEITRFLRAIARLRLRDIDAAIIEGFQAKAVPWKSVLELAEAEGIGGFLFHHRDRLAAAPASFHSDLTRRSKTIRAQTTRMLKEVDRIAGSLEHAGIRAVALQGLSLLSAYEDLHLRPLGDVDLLVAGEQKPQFIRVLVRLGFRPAAAHYPELLQRNGVCFDIHTHVLDRLTSLRDLIPIDQIELLQQRSQPLYGRRIRAPERLDNLMALCAHVFKHGYSRLIWLVDLHETIRLVLKNDPNAWGPICRRAGEWQQEKPLLYALLLLESIFGLTVPMTARKRLGFEALGCVEKYLLRLIRSGFRSRYLPHALYLQLLGDIASKAGFLREALYPQNAILTQVLFDQGWKPGLDGYLRRFAGTGLQVASDLKRAVDCRLSA